MAKKYFYISPAISLQFSIVYAIDNCTIFPNPDNQTYCSDTPLGYTVVNYNQLYQNCDTLTIQFRSDYSNHEIDLINKSDVIVDTYIPTLIDSNISETTTYSGFIRDNTGVQVRVYFDQITFPNVGQSITVSDNPSYNGSYTVVATGYDSDLKKSYTIITVPYAGIDFDSITITIQDSTVSYSLYEFQVDFALIPQDTYRVNISASETDFDTINAVSEWIELKSIHKNAKLIEYKNSVNEFAIDYSTGLINKIRVYSYFFKRKPQGEQTTFYNKDELIKLHAKTRRFTDLEVPEVPPWMNEKLSLAFAHDFFTVNGIEHQTEEVYQPEYKDLYSLSSGKIALEQVNWTGDFNIESEPYFYCSPANSLTFTEAISIDDCNVLPNHDNTTYCSDKQGRYSVANYLQPFQTCDLIKIQFRSNYETNEVSVVDTNGIEQFVPIVTEVINGTTGLVSYTGIVVNDNTGAETKVYFDQAVFPDISVSDSVNIFGTSGLDGSYTVTSIGYDILRNQQFLTINNASVPITEQSATISISNSELGYNVYEFEIDWSTLGIGAFRVLINFDDNAFGAASLVSEYVSVKDNQEQTYFVKYKNSFDQFGIDYSTGIENLIRVPAYFYKRSADGESDTYTDAETTVKFGAIVRRQIALEVLQLPPYMHEKLALAFSHDFFSINTIEFQTEELYEPEYIDQYSLSSGSVNIQQVNWIGAVEDTEQVEETYILVESGPYLLFENNDKVIVE